MVAAITITEALQEIKTIGARLLKKRDAIGKYVVRDIRIRDPFDAEGGSAAWIAQERQSIRDLEHRVIAIRRKIQEANLFNMLTVGSETMTVNEWLTWRREIAGNQRAFLAVLFGAIDSTRKAVQAKGGKLLPLGSNQNAAVDRDAPPEVIAMVPEQELIAQIENHEATYGALDGKLSLFNATTYVEI